MHASRKLSTLFSWTILFWISFLANLAAPTRDNPTNAAGMSGIAPPQFSVKHGFFDAPFDLVLETTMPEAVIRYTTDGSEPTESSGAVFTGAIPIANTTVIRAAVFNTNMPPSSAMTQTYIFPAQVLQQPSNPAGFPDAWGSWTLVDYQMHPEIVNSPTYAALAEQGLTAISTLSIALNVDDMFGNNGIYSNPQLRGRDRVRKGSVELIYPDGREGFQMDCGVRIQGGGSRNPSNSPKHSLRLLFQARYGPGKLQFRFFADSPVEEFEAIQLRAEYNNSWIHWSPSQRLRGGYVRDLFARDTQLAMEQLASHGNHVHLYINGLYWGLYNPTERPDGAFAASYLGGERGEYDVINEGRVADGDLTAWNTMMNMARAGLASESQYQAIQQYLDVPNLIDYMIINLYGGNVDWPGHNWYALRKREPGAGFKFICWDSERTLENINENRTGVSNNNTPAFLYAQLRANPEFRLLFADHVHRHFFNNGALTPNAAIRRWLYRARQIQEAVVDESARWGYYRRDVHVRGPAALYTYFDHLLPEQNRLVNEYFLRRTSIVLGQFQAIGLYPMVVAPAFNQHGGQVPRGFSLTMSAPAGTIYYTTNGEDPRIRRSGAISPSARMYTNGNPVVLDRSVFVKARVLSAGQWSAVNRAKFKVETP
jgi:hypothetical protein